MIRYYTLVHLLIEKTTRETQSVILCRTSKNFNYEVKF